MHRRPFRYLVFGFFLIGNPPLFQRLSIHNRYSLRQKTSVELAPFPVTLPLTPTRHRIMEATLTANPLQEQVQCALNRSPYISQKRIQFKTFAGRVRLEGTVGSFYQKQMAQELVRRVDGVELVENQLQVSWR